MDTLRWRTSADLAQLLGRAERLLDGDRRSVLAIAGAPASGKSTLAAALVTALGRSHPDRVVLLGMDAFHLGHRVLEAKGLVALKGAPETFDPLGFMALLERIRSEKVTVFAPEFHREIEDSLAQSVEIGPQVQLVITEGNYLLLPQSPWDGLRKLFDEAWFVHLDDGERQRRMIARHLSFGHSPEVAAMRTLGSDEANAQLVNRAQMAPDLWIERLD